MYLYFKSGKQYALYRNGVARKYLVRKLKNDNNNTIECKLIGFHFQ